MGPSSKYVSSRHIVDLRQPQVAMKHRLRSVKNTCVAQSLYSEFRPLNIEISRDMQSQIHNHSPLKNHPHLSTGQVSQQNPLIPTNQAGNSHVLGVCIIGALNEIFGKTQIDFSSIR